MRHLLSGLFLALVLHSAPAQMRIDVSGVGATQYPIAIAAFATDGRAPQQVVDVVRGDLARSGMFRIIDPQTTLSDTAAVDFADIRARGADAVLGGSIARLADGRYDIRFRLSDAVRQNVLGGESLMVTEPDLRFGAHRIADWVFEKITGEKGIFSTRIAFISRQGK
ncbi:MAG: Tol-Pal system protein TolB, partial [Burkholderiaceae bacterium]|nr:Tol-Pal system protein TolB [Burkholderiaceae bacterium]